MNRFLSGVDWRRFVCLGAAILCAYRLPAQLAITEMMSSRRSGADFFELTNFGTNVIDLAGFKFTDADHGSRREDLVPTGESVLLVPGESILFARTNLNPTEFRAFWSDCLDTNTQFRLYTRPGFSSYGDSLAIFDSHKQIVDRVGFRATEPGISFTYDAQTGAFGVPSSLAASGCLSATNGNIASPGRTTGPVPLQITRQPRDLMVCPTLEGHFSVEAVGMPRPHFQWLLNGSEIPGAQQQSLVISNTLADAVGAYSVRVSNGLSNIISAPAFLSLDSTPRPPSVVVPPFDLTAVEGRTARFAIEVCAQPPARYQWSSNGVTLPDQTNRVLFVRNITSEISGSTFCVSAENGLGSVTNCAKLYVTNSSPLRITEVQANPLPECDGHNDWFEVTNFGATDVHMRGYRLSDQFALDDTFVIDQDLILQPYESAIFVKNSSIGSFFDWWGPEQLPATLQVIPFSGFSLGSDGDALYLWNDTAEDPNEFLDSISFVSNSPGKSRSFEATTGSEESVLNVNGAVQAVECGDVGTPGFTRESRPEFTSIRPVTEGIQLTWRATEGATYRIDAAVQLSGPWSSLQEVVATNSFASAQPPIDGSPTGRFYRLNRITLP